VSTLPLFDGRTYLPERDGKRLKSQLEAVRYVMSDGRWRTIPEIHRELSVLGFYATETSISSRIRDLRKSKFGAFEVSSQPTNQRGLWAYRIEVIS
jgi:hypothetical protein